MLEKGMSKLDEKLQTVCSDIFIESRAGKIIKLLFYVLKQKSYGLSKNTPNSPQKT